MVKRNSTKHIYLRILLCVIIAAFTFVSMGSGLYAEGDSDFTYDTATVTDVAGETPDPLPPHEESIILPPDEGSNEETATDTPLPEVSTPTDLPEEPAEPLPIQPGQENEIVEAETPVNESGAVPDAIPAWAESGQPYIKGNLGMAEQFRLLASALDERIDTARAEFGASESVQITYSANNTADMLAVYAVKSGMADNYPYYVTFQTREQSEILQSIFWEMTDVTAEVRDIDGERSCLIRVERKTYLDMLDRYGLADQASELEALTTPEVRSVVSSQLGSSILSRLSDEAFQAIERQLEGVSGERRAVVLAALSLEGKIGYFWGGKSYHVGWDDRWGEDRVVTSDGSSQYGTIRPFGLDCSGFVSWAFINAGGDQNIIQYIGSGTSMQWYNSRAIGMSELCPGDLLFYSPPGRTGINHVGIYIGGGNVVHCTTNGTGGVVVTGLGRFAYARTPYLYGDS